MIFRQIDEILQGKKTQTRRLVKPGEQWATSVNRTVLTGDRIKWQVGRTYAVQPGRGKPAVWWKPTIYGVPVTHNGTHDWHYPADPDRDAIALPITHAQLERDGWNPLRIRILSIRQERLQDINEADARAEGVESVEAYRALWDSINGKTKGARWADNPHVLVLGFEVMGG